MAFGLLVHLPILECRFVVAVAAAAVSVLVSLSFRTIRTDIDHADCLVLLFSSILDTQQKIFPHCQAAASPHI